jgi:hypothetical protein
VAVVPSALEDAKRFLYLHPYATTAEDNPVKLLQSVVDEVEAGSSDDDDDDEGMKPSEEQDGATLMQKVVSLVAFVKGLRDDMKISEAEYQTAVALTK